MLVLDSKNPFTLLAILSAVFVLPFIFWGYGELFATANSSKSVEHQLSYWQNNKPESFRYKLRYGCMAPTEINAVVAKDAIWIEGENKSGYVSIEDLFEIVETAKNQAYSITTTYNKRYGFPSSISVDWGGDIADDECFYQVEMFSPL